MVIDMNDEQLKTLADLQGILDGTVMMDFAVAGEERCHSLSALLLRGSD